MTQNADYIDILEKLRLVIEEDHQVNIFSRDEVKTLRRMIGAYTLLLGWGTLGKLTIWAILTAGAVLTAMGKIGWVK